MVRVIIAKEKLNCEHLLGQFVDESHYDILIEKDTDCYLPSMLGEDKSEKNIAFKFRKNFFTKQEQKAAYEGLREAATQSQNRGLAAGPKGDKCMGRDWVREDQLRILDLFKKEPENTAIPINIKQEVIDIIELYKDAQTTRGLVWLSAKVKQDNFDWNKWLKKVIKLPTAQRKQEANDLSDNYISDTTYANPVFSGIAGWFDRYPRIPYGRATSYTQHHYDKFEKSFPFLQSLDRGFKELLPQRWGNQRAAANTMDQRFLVPGTVFSTITVNKTFRTACHRDAGDFSDGLSNLLVLSNDGRFTGGYLVFPEYRTAINVRPGDLLLVNNHEIIHGNTPIVCEDGSERISLVCYLREKMLELGSYEYENLRYEYVESRRKNKEHKHWRNFWNGISEGMWEEQEWYEYLETHGGREMLNKYHPEANETTGTLEHLFG